MATRAKWLCQSVEDYGQSKKINLTTVYEGPLGENEENKRFTQASPSGSCWITIDNPLASVQFSPGRYYYSDWSEAPVDATKGA